MPALPAAAGVIRTAFSGTDNANAVWLSRFYQHYSGTPPTNTQLATFDASMITNWNADMKSLQSAGFTLTQVASEDLTSASGAVDVTATSQAGTRAGSMVTGGACVVVSYEIARRYRGGHPRGYWPFGSDSDIANAGTWSTALVSACNTGVAAFFTANAAAGWTGAGTITHVNVSYYSGFHVVTNPITGRARNVPLLRVSPTIDTVTSITTRSSIGSQRRRIQFVA